MSRRRVVGAALTAAAAVPIAAGVAYVARAEPDAGATPTAAVATGTAEATRGTLTQRVQIDGVLGYTGAYRVDHQGTPGVLTAAAGPGDVVRRGSVLYRVADAPVHLLLGAVPAYRDLRYGMSEGPDVRQLERNLVAMGFDPHRRMTVDRHFSAATAAAIRRWEASLGRPAYQRTGRLTWGRIVFLPAPLRVTARQTRIGATVPPGGAVLAGTSTNRVVTAQLGTAERSTVRVGDQVEVSFPDAGPVRGRVAAVGQVATAPAHGEGGGPSGPDEPGEATVPVTVAVRPPRGFGLDQAPVTVDITTDTRRDVLLVPIAALLARPGGGYQVRLVDGSTAEVELGGFDESSGQVEIRRGLTAGRLVEVPAS